jgi:DNA-binding XRE family transcriptional regulator
MNLGKAVQKIREERGVTRRDIEKKTGITTHTVYVLEKNIYNTRITTISLIADALGVKVSDIFLEAEKYA